MDNIKYSNDFQFFIENQIAVWTLLDGTTSFCSRLESRCFYSIRTKLCDEMITKEIVRYIHLKLKNNKETEKSLSA